MKKKKLNLNIENKEKMLPIRVPKGYKKTKTTIQLATVFSSLISCSKIRRHICDTACQIIL